MSTNAKKGRAPEEESKQAKKDVPKPKASPPTAAVGARHVGQMVERPGRGYSRGELAQVGLGAGTARKWKVRVDDRRRTVLEGNVAALKGFASGLPKTSEAKTGELEKVERFVEKELHRVQKDVKKVEKEVVKEVEAPLKKVRKKAPPKKAKKKTPATKKKKPKKGN